MRTLTIGILAAAAFGHLTAAQAADLDYDVLRGPDYYEEPVAAPVIDWSGAYLGGHGGYSSAALGFKNVYHDIIYNEFHDTSAETVFGISSLLRSAPKRIDGASFGAFAGYNFQFDDIVVGVEADYTYFGGIGSSTDTQGRFKTLADGSYEAVYVSGSSSTKVEDFGTIRARVGYALGSFLPFVTGGLAIGRAEIADRVSYRDYGFDQASFLAGKTAYANFGYAPNTFSYTNPYSSVGATSTLPTYAKTKTVGGIALGGGIEYAITSNILLRGEYQYVLFNDFDGHAVNINTVRGGAAVKF